MNSNEFHRSVPAADDPGFRAISTKAALPEIRDEESLRDIIKVLRKRKVFILLVTAGALAAAILLCLVMPSQYTSTATLLVDKDDTADLDLGGLSSLASAVGGMDDVKTDLQTHAAVLQSNTTILNVVKAFKLQMYKPYKYEPSFFPWASQLRAERGLPLDQAPATRERLLKIFSKRLVVEPVEDTRLITVSYRDPDAARSAAVANKIVDTYIQEYLQTKFKATAEASNWLSGELSDLKNRVDVSQEKLSDYERKTGLSTLMLGLSLGDTQSNSSSGGMGGGLMMSGGSQLPEVDRLAALNTELTAAEADRIAKEAIYRLTQTENPEVVLGLGSTGLASIGGGSSVMSQGNGLEFLQALRQQQSTLKMNYADAVSKYGTRNPRLAELQGQMSALNDQIHDEMQRIRLRAHNDFLLAQKNEASLRGEYQKQQEVVSKLNDSTVELENLAGEALSSRTLYQELYTRLQEANIEAGVKATNLTLVDPALIPSEPSRPNWLIYPGIGLGAGLLFGIGGAFVKDNIDDKITAPEQVEHISSYPVLAAIPAIRARDLQEPGLHTGMMQISDPHMLVNQPMAGVSECFRSLRTAILLSNTVTPLQVLLVTSSLGEEGKSTVSSHLAVAFAQHGNRVLLIDADMRKPSLGRMFKVPKSPGLSEVLTGNATMENCTCRVDAVPLLDILPSGTRPPTPADLIGSPRLDELLAQARKTYDTIIIDSPPVLFVTDPIVLSTKVDGTMVVIRAGVTRRPALERISKFLNATSGRKLGFVLNAIDMSSSEYYYSYGHYGNAKYYEEKDEVQ